MISLLALGAFWLLVYRATPLTASVVVIEGAVVIALAFAYASRSAR